MSWDLIHTALAMCAAGVILLAFAGWERRRDYR